MSFLEEAEFHLEDLEFRVIKSAFNKDAKSAKVHGNRRKSRFDRFLFFLASFHEKIDVEKV